MNQETLDRIIKQQMFYWLFSIGFATALALFAKLIWTAKFPILMLMPLLMIGFAFGAIGLIKKELTPLVVDGSKSDV